MANAVVWLQSSNLWRNFSHFSFPRRTNCLATRQFPKTYSVCLLRLLKAKIKSLILMCFPQRARSHPRSCLGSVLPIVPCGFILCRGGRGESSPPASQNHLTVCPTREGQTRCTVSFSHVSSPTAPSTVRITVIGHHPKAVQGAPARWQFFHLSLLGLCNAQGFCAIFSRAGFEFVCS